MFFIVISLSFSKISLSAIKKWVLAYIRPCNIPSIFSHYNYTVYTLSLPFIKTRRSGGLTLAVHTKCGC